MRMGRTMARAGLVLGLLLAVGCHADGGGHGHEHGAGGHDDHDDHGGGHGHGESDRPTHVVTMFGEHTELFVEFPAFVGGVPSEFAAHFTTLSDYKPVTEGKLGVVLTSPDSPGERWDADDVARHGIFTPAATPKYAGKRKLVLLLETADFTESFDLGEFTVFESKDAARKVEVENPEGEISYLKEQQWKVDFDVHEVEQRKLRPSLPVNATLRPAADGEAIVVAPFDGRVSAPEGGIPQVGETVTEGQIMAYVVPKLDAGQISATQAELRKAEVMLTRARRDEARIRGLVDSGALPARRLADVQSEVELAQAEVAQARRRLGQSNTVGARRGARNGAVAIRSAIEGVVAQRGFVDGGFVSSGQQLLRVIDRSQMWLEAHVPEANLDRVTEPTGAWFEGPDNGSVEIDVTQGGRLVSFGEVIDPVTRTAPMIFELGEAGKNVDLRIGGFVKAHILNGEPREVVAVPASAVLDEQGMDVVYVMVGGESFTRRIVRLGVRDREYVEVIEGLEAGDIVVSEGPYYVKLASSSTGSIGHGHAH